MYVCSCEWAWEWELASFSDSLPPALHKSLGIWGYMRCSSLIPMSFHWGCIVNGNGKILAWFPVLRKTSWLSALIKCGVLCPTVMVHMMCVSVSETARQDLECVARTFFKMDNQTGWVEWGRDHCQTPEKVHQSHAVGDLKQAKDDLTLSHFSAHFCVNERKSSVTTPPSLPLLL